MTWNPNTKSRLTSCARAFCARFKLGDDAAEVFKASVRELVDMELREREKKPKREKPQ